MLLHVQKPGLSYAASARDWRDRFGRRPKEGARPLIILWPFGPVALVYDVMDTEGKPLPEDVESFFARGDIDEIKLRSFEPAAQEEEHRVVLGRCGRQEGGFDTCSPACIQRQGSHAVPNPHQSQP